MKPVSVHVSYKTTFSQEPIVLEQILESANVGPFDIACTADDAGFEVRIVPRVPVTVEGCLVILDHEFSRKENVLLNGYQSWTVTTEENAFATAHGLTGVPQQIIDAWTLDASGDYRFTDYRIGPGSRHGYTYATFETDGTFTLLGSLNDSTCFTLIRTYAALGIVTVDAKGPARQLKPGEEVTLLSVAIEQGTQREVYDRWLARLGVTARTQTPLCGYTSWYRHYENIDENAILRDLEGAQSAFEKLDAHGFTRAFQIDDGWAVIGDWDTPRANRFPVGMAPIASSIRAAGFVPGLWMAPFVCEKDSATYCKHPDWLLRDADGNEVSTGSHWSGHVALDTRNQEVRAAIRSWIGTAVQGWGFGLLKLDFLYAACMLPHDGLSRSELMTDAVHLLREGAGEDCLLLGCGVPLVNAFGIFDYCRIGCDVGLDWDDKPHMRLLHRERVSTKNSLLSTIGRSPLDGRVFGNDPDVVFLRDNIALSSEQRELLLLAASSLASVLMTSDNMAAWDDDKLSSYQTALDTMRSRK